MKWTYPATALAVVVAAGLAAPAAYSGMRTQWQETQMMQPANWGGHMHDGYGHHAHRHGGFGWGDRMDGAHMEGWVAFMKAELAITADQEPQWQAFTDTLRQATTDMRALRGTTADTGDDDEQPRMSAPERLDRMERFAAAGLDAVRRVRAPFADLYAALSDDQKGRADRLFDHRPWR